MHSVSPDDEVTLVHVSIKGADPDAAFSLLCVLLYVGDCFVDVDFGLVG